MPLSNTLLQGPPEDLRAITPVCSGITLRRSCSWSWEPRRHAFLGPQPDHRGPDAAEPQSQLPVRVRPAFGDPARFRFGISFYLIAMLFILFDIEVISCTDRRAAADLRGFALAETITFVVLLMVAFVYVWRRGALEWK